MDEQIRRRKREARAEGDTRGTDEQGRPNGDLAPAAAAAERDALRSGDENTRQGWLQRRVGLVIFIEGIRINWRGRFLRFLNHADGRVSDLVLGKGAERIGDMNASGPNRTYTLKVNAPETLVPWETVIGTFEDLGFNGQTWPKLQE